MISQYLCSNFGFVTSCSVHVLHLGQPQAPSVQGFLHHAQVRVRLLVENVLGNEAPQLCDAHKLPGTGQWVQEVSENVPQKLC